VAVDQLVLVPHRHQTANYRSLSSDSRKWLPAYNLARNYRSGAILAAGQEIPIRCLLVAPKGLVLARPHPLLTEIKVTVGNHIRISFPKLVIDPKSLGFPARPDRAG
jgi:hypothetical protein